MSTQDYSLVAAGQTFTIPSTAGSDLLGPFTLYTLGQGQIARVEAVTFQANIAHTLGGPVSFVVQLCDPSSNLLWQLLVPPFLEGV